MANVTHVIPKTKWKKVKLDTNFFSGVDFTEPSCIEVLEDYTISSTKTKSTRNEEAVTKKRKLKAKKKQKKTKVNSGNQEDFELKEVQKKKEADSSTKKKAGQKRKQSKEDVNTSQAKKMKISPSSLVLDDKNTVMVNVKKETTVETENKDEIEINKEKFQKEKAPGMETWDGLRVPNQILWALKDLGFTFPTPIQARTLPSAIRDKLDIVGAAETGSGKTLAFGIPILYYILEAKKGNTERTAKKDETKSNSDSSSDSGSDQSDNETEESVIETMEGESGAEEEETLSDDDGDDDDDDASDDDVMDENTDKEDLEDFEDDNSDEEDIEDLPENEFGCVKVIKDVDFSWIEKENNQDKSKLKTHPFALVLEPTRELAIQVKNHLTAIAKYTDIKIATIVGGMSIQKQRRVLKHCPDVVVATPGRLWDLMEEGVCYLSEIEKVNQLVIDEADRMVEKGHFEELASLLRKMNRDPKWSSRRHTYVFSATLTTLHEGPQRYKKWKKNKVMKLTETQKLDMLMESIGLKAKPKVVDLTRKVGTVETLTEARIHCSNEEKDIYLYYFLKQYPGRTLVFCNSKDCIRRLVSVFNYLKCTPLPLHADMHQRQRLKNLDRFTGNPKGLLIASDVAARGLDIPNVQHVIHFQVPNIVENYIHRSGRTARASKEGLSVMLIGPNDMKNYKKIINTLNRDEDLPMFPVEPEYITEVKQRVDLVCKIETQEYRFQKGKRQNDWFKKMAEDSGIDIEDQGLFTDIGDERKQAEHKRNLKHLKAELEMLLRQPIVPRAAGGRFPTKTGKLDIPVYKNNSEGAISHLKLDKKKQDKYMEQIRQNPQPLKVQKKKKDKWKKKKKNRNVAKTEG